MLAKKKLLIFVDWFWPGYKAGGQIASCVNIAAELYDDMDVYVVTTDRDMGDDKPFDSVIIDEWNHLDNGTHVLYLSPKKRGFKSIQAIIRFVNPHCIYLNSMFSFNFTLLPIEACRYNVNNLKVVLAPRGMLHKGALQYKNFKKKVFFHAFKIRGFQKRIVFHATDQTEVVDIKKIFGEDVAIRLVKDFPASKQFPLTGLEKLPGSLNCLFLSRISPKKNLSYLISLLQQVRSNVTLSIVGPIEDADYWFDCEKLIKTLPSNIKTNYLGPFPNDQLPGIYRQHHMFALPTHGENFGHVIFDSFLHGRPVLVSDHTPWTGLEENGIGWNFSLADKRKFVDAIEQAAGWDQSKFDNYCKASWDFASSYLHSANLKSEYLQLFG